MKDFVAPAIATVDIALETAYIASGFKPTDSDKTPEAATDGDWNITCEWRNHNSGSHSELAIKGKHHGNNSGNHLTMDIFIDSNNNLNCVKDWGGMVVTNQNAKGFTITRNNFFNPTDNFEFNIQVTCVGGQYSGAYGKTGDPCPVNVFCTGYYSS